MSNEQSNVVTKVIDFRHKAPDQAIHELMQAAKDGYAVTKIATRFNHTHVYLETNVKQVSTSKSGVNSKESEVSSTEVKSGELVGKEPEKEVVTQETPTKVTPKKTTAKTTAKKSEPKDGE